MSLFSYSLSRIVNKLITNNETARDTISEMRAKPHKALWNQQRLKRRLEHSFRIVKQLPFHSAPKQI